MHNSCRITFFLFYNVLFLLNSLSIYIYLIAGDSVFLQLKFIILYYYQVCKLNTRTEI